MPIYTFTLTHFAHPMKKTYFRPHKNLVKKKIIIRLNFYRIFDFRKNEYICLVNFKLVFSLRATMGLTDRMYGTLKKYLS